MIASVPKEHKLEQSILKLRKGYENAKKQRRTTLYTNYTKTKTKDTKTKTKEQKDSGKKTTQKNVKDFKVYNFNEFKDKNIFGWSPKSKNPIYSPRNGLLKNAPKYNNAGPKWRKIIEKRCSQANTPPSLDVCKSLYGLTDLQIKKIKDLLK